MGRACIRPAPEQRREGDGKEEGLGKSPSSPGHLSVLCPYCGSRLFMVASGALTGVLVWSPRKSLELLRGTTHLFSLTFLPVTPSPYLPGP